MLVTLRTLNKYMISFDKIIKTFVLGQRIDRYEVAPVQRDVSVTLRDEFYQGHCIAPA
ncbi:hypothetical protein D3C72_749840 [compost metagenome]